MAEVFLAVAQGAMDVNRLVVVKRLREEQADDETARDMFLNEARLAARLAHPNVIQTFEAGTEGGSYFLAMEYIDGQPLSRLLRALMRANRRMEPKIAARICADALHGLHYAHELTDFDGSPLDIVHRDVSPQNIMLTYDGVVKIVDFGIAKVSGTKQTELGVFKGKVAFMAPEQLSGSRVDRRVDVFAAGIVLWEAVTGMHLFADETPAKTLYNLVHKQIPRASEVRADIPQALDDILATALERDVAKRYATAKEMRDALESFIASAGGTRADEIGALVTSFFADGRTSIQREIRAQLAALSLGHRSESEPSLAVPQSSGTHIRSTRATLVDLSDATFMRTASTSAGVFRMVTGSGVVPAPETKTGRFAVVLRTFLMFGVIGVSGLALFRTLRPPEREVAITSPTTSTAAPPPTPIPAPVPTPVPTPIADPVPAPAPARSVALAPATATHVAAQPAAPAWRPPPPSRPTPPTPPAPVAVEPVKSPPAPTATPATKPETAPTGRTFSRDL